MMFYPVDVLDHGFPAFFIHGPLNWKVLKMRPPPQAHTGQNPEREEGQG